jgi:hypothetical protein
MKGKRAVGKAGLRAANLRPKEAWAASALGAPARWTPSKRLTVDSTGKREFTVLATFVSLY